MKAQDRKVVIRDATLSPEARFIWVLIETWANKDGSNAFPTQERLILATGRDRKWFFKYYGELRERGFVSVRKSKFGGKWHNVYTVNHSPQKRDYHPSPKTGHYQVPYTRTGAGPDWGVQDSAGMLSVVPKEAAG